MPKRSPFELILLVAGGMVLLFVVAPLLGMILQTGGAALVATAADREVRQSIWLTLWTSMAGTLLLAIPTIPFAYFLARRNFPGKGLLLGIIDLPVIIPHTAAGIALLGVINRGSRIGRLCEWLNDGPLAALNQALGTDWRLTMENSVWGVMLAMAFVSLPFLINASREGFAAVPERLEKTALTLGASPARVFFTVSLPLAWRSILTGIVMMFARGLSEFGAVVIIAYHPMIAPVLIYERFGAFGLAYSRPVAVLFILVCLVVFIVLRFLSGGKRRVEA